MVLTISIVCILFFQQVVSLSRPCEPILGVAKCQKRQYEMVPSDIATNTEILDLSHNIIYYLHEDNFRGLVKLRKLIINDNKLWKITEYAFKHLSNLEELSLEKNDLVIRKDSLSVTALAHLTNLRILRLSQNPLGVIPSGFFQFHGQLRELYIDQAIKNLPIEEGAFRGLVRLTTLSMVNNGFRTLPSHLQPDIAAMNLSRILLDTNQWQCNCKLRWLSLWFAQRNKLVIVKTKRFDHPGKPPLYPQCVGPRIQRRSLLFEKKSSLFQCQPRLSKNVTNIKRSFRMREGHNVTFSCGFISDPRRQVEWYHNDSLLVSSTPRCKLSASNGNNFTTNLTIIQLKRSDHGLYTCRTKNNRGSANISFSLLVIPTGTKLKPGVILTLVAIGASGLVVLAVSIAIVVYCFYGNNTHINKYHSPNAEVINQLQTPEEIAHLSTLNANQIKRQSQGHTSEISARLSDINMNTRLIGVKEESENGEVSAFNATSTREPGKRVVINISNQLQTPTKQLQTVGPDNCSSVTNNSTGGGSNDQCPIHGSRLNYSPCPVHGTLGTHSTTQTQSTSTVANSIAMNNKHPCPLHGSSNPTPTTTVTSSILPHLHCAPPPSSSNQACVSLSTATSTTSSSLRPTHRTTATLSLTTRHSASSIATVAPTQITASSATVAMATLPRVRMINNANTVAGKPPLPPASTFQRASQLDDTIMINPFASITSNTENTEYYQNPPNNVVSNVSKYSNTYNNSLPRSVYRNSLTRPNYQIQQQQQQPLPPLTPASSSPKTISNSTLKNSSAITLPRNFSPGRLPTFVSNSTPNNHVTSTSGGAIVRFQETVEINNLADSNDEDSLVIRRNGYETGTTYCRENDEDHFSTAV